MKKTILITLSLLLITSCKIDEEENKVSNIQDPQILKEVITKLENEGKIPSDLDRTPYLLGIDANNNGVRDDVEAWINKKYPNQIKEAMQFARAKQMIMGLDTADELALRKANLEEVRAINCLYFKRDKSKDLIVVSRMIKEISSITKNTKERVLAELSYGRAMNGKMLSKTKDEEACDD